MDFGELTPSLSANGYHTCGNPVIGDGGCVRSQAFSLLRQAHLLPVGCLRQPAPERVFPDFVRVQFAAPSKYRESSARGTRRHHVGRCLP
jgi:hypothetical protein